MRAVSENQNGHAIKNDRIKRQRTEERFGQFIFPALFKQLWPLNTAAELATIGGSHPRTAEFWLSGKVEAPPIVYAAALAEALKRDRELRAALRG
jgi:hypothetical protein